MGVAHRSILVVDDDPDIGEVLGIVLEKAGYAVVAVQNGADALTQLRGGFRPCVILLDLMMPIMNGWQFRAEQCQDPALSSIPVVILTADWDSADKAKSLGLTCLRKPVELRLLFDVIKRHCG